jgi:hypothetical protein
MRRVYPESGELDFQSQAFVWHLIAISQNFVEHWMQQNLDRYDSRFTLVLHNLILIVPEIFGT